MAYKAGRWAQRMLGDLKGDFLILFVAVFLIQLALGLQRTTFNNFANDILGLMPSEVGLAGSIREVPGLFTVVLIAAVAGFRQSVVVGLSGLVVAVGLFLHGVSSDLSTLLIAVVVMSIGFHVLGPVQASLVLSLSGPGEKGRRMGQFSGAQAAASLIAVGLVFALAEPISGLAYYRVIYWGGAVLAVLGGILILKYTRDAEMMDARPQRFVFKPAYMSFYVLRLLTASQRHIFFTFAVFLMVREHGMSVQTTAVLMGVSHALGIYVRPAIGGLVDRFGTRTVIRWGYAVATCTALTYAFVPVLAILYVAYCIDALVASLEVAISVHLDGIAQPIDLRPTLALGSTINHILGLIVPIAGGILWDAVNFRATFIMGAVLTLLVVIYTKFMPPAGEGTDLTPGEEAA